MTAPLTKTEINNHRPQSLRSIRLAWGLPDDAQAAWLLDQGISVDALCHPWPIGSALVKFDRGTFDVNERGVRALTSYAQDRGEVLDLVAWSPRTGEIGSWLGTAFCLGDVDDIWNPGTYALGGALSIHADPLAWLRADRQGIVIVNPKLTYSYLHNAPRVSFADPNLAEQFQRWVRPPEPTIQLFLEQGIMP